MYALCDVSCASRNQSASHTSDALGAGRRRVAGQGGGRGGGVVPDRGGRGGRGGRGPWSQWLWGLGLGAGTGTAVGVGAAAAARRGGCCYGG